MLTDVLYAAIVAVCAFATGYRFGRVRKYVYGTCGPAGEHARRRWDGVVELAVWRSGGEFCWASFDTAWWPTFKEYDNA